MCAEQTVCREAHEFYGKARRFFTEVRRHGMLKLSRNAGTSPELVKTAHEHVFTKSVSEVVKLLQARKLR